MQTTSFPSTSSIKIYSKAITTQMEALKVLLTSSDSKAPFDKQLNEMADLLANIQKESIPMSSLISNECFRALMDTASAWILKNFNNSKLLTILSLISSFLMTYNHKTDIKEQEITNLIHCETIDHLNEKKEELSKEETLGKDSILTNSFLSALYSLIVTISNKPEIIIKSKNLLRQLTVISTQIVEVDNVSLYYKKRRLITVYSTIIKELKKSSDPNAQLSLVIISKLVMVLFSKIGIKRSIYRDYMFKKAIPDKLSDIYLQFYSNDPELTQTFALYTVYSCRTGDHKTYYWTKGIITTFIDVLRSSKEEKMIERVSLALYILVKDSSEIQDDLKEQNYLDLAKKLVVGYSTNNNIVYYIVSTLRRIKDKEFYSQMSKELLFTFFALFDFYYITVKKEMEQQKKASADLSVLSNKTYFIVLKELVAILGNIVKDESHFQPFVEKNLHLVFVDLTLSFYKFPKLIKNTIGALINLTTSEEIRERLSKVAAFIQAIYLVLDQYKDNQFIVDYTLKMIVNVLKNDVSVNTFLSGDLYFYLLMFLKNFEKNDEITLNSIKIIRALITKIKGLNEFLEKTEDFYVGLYEDINPKEKKDKVYQLFLDDLINFLAVRGENAHLAIEVINLLAYLSNQNDKMKTMMDKNKKLMASLNGLIMLYSNDETLSKSISLSIAQLPIEELSFLNDK